jgi:heat-inducible transcriptional repressor
VERDIFDILDERSRRVLNAVVRSYIDRPDPVGSRFVTRKYSFGFSSATIRNIMSDLEEMGFLSQPHTSAGRVPTDKGYRFYVDSLSNEAQSEKIIEVPEEFIQQFSRRLDEFKNDISAMFSEVTNTLSSLSNYVSIVLPPKAENTTFNRIDLIKFKSDQIVAILLTDEGIIHNKVIQADPMLKQRMKREKAQWDRLISRAISIYEQAMTFAEGDIFVSGLYDLMDLPEFSDISKLRELSKAIKEKHVIMKLLAELSHSEGVQVLIGTENPVTELKGLSVITSMYKEGSRPMGIIALIGPTRMDYSKAIIMVDTITKCVSRTFED